MQPARDRPKLERLQRRIGLGLRVAVGVACIGALVAIAMRRSGSGPVSKLDVAMIGAIVVTTLFVTIPGKVASRSRQKATALAFGVGVAFLFLEGFVRIFDPFPILLRAGRIDLPVKLKKEFSTDGQSGLDASISVSFNSLGFRGPEPPDDWENHLTIICVGGSTTQCLYLSEGTTWPDQLSRRLANDIKSVWVNNAGIDGHSTFGHLELLDQYLAVLRPKVLLFLVGLNDVDRSDLNTFDQSTLRSQSRVDDSLTRSLQRMLLRNSDSFALLDNLRLQWSARQKGLIHGEPIAHATFSTQAGSRQLSPEARMKWLNSRDPTCLTGFKDRLTAIVDRCAGLQIRCVLATQPVVYGVGVDELTGIDLAAVPVGEVDGATHWELLQRYNQVTREVGLESNIKVIDLANQLPKSSRYFYDLTHYNIAGAEEVASIIYRELTTVLSDLPPTPKLDK